MYSSSFVESRVEIEKILREQTPLYRHYNHKIQSNMIELHKRLTPFAKRIVSVINLACIVVGGSVCRHCPR
jgi:hypothetical protein